MSGRESKYTWELEENIRKSGEGHFKFEGKSPNGPFKGSIPIIGEPSLLRGKEGSKFLSLATDFNQLGVV